MAQRRIRQIGDEILRKKSKDVVLIDARLRTLVDDMFETMEANEGCGLAAVQVGVLRRVVVIDTKQPGERMVLINPVILQQSGRSVGIEGCLSVKERSGYVERPTYVKVQAKDIQGEEFVMEARDFLARAVCHELDHLEGILYTDKLTQPPKPAPSGKENEDGAETE